MKSAYLILAITLTGCSSITSDKMQSLALTTQDQTGQIIDKAKCTLHNDKGTWEAESPGFVAIHRSAEDLEVECVKEGQPNGLLKAISRAGGSMWGNIVFGGGIGAIIDHSNGSGYNYPDKLVVKMGASEIIDRKDEKGQKGEKKEPAEDSKKIAATSVEAKEATTTKQ